jgi:hypothetical protein
MKNATEKIAEELELVRIPEKEKKAPKQVVPKAWPGKPYPLGATWDGKG